MIKIEFKKEYQELIDSDIPNDEKLMVILQDTVNYYEKNPDRRCVSSTGCRYDSKTLGLEGEGCAIGRLVTEETREKLDIYPDLAVGGKNFKGNQIADIQWGEYINSNIDFFTDLQGLHDEDGYWNEVGLTDEGVERYEYILTTLENER